jgi:hypothetical protein
MRVSRGEFRCASKSSGAMSMRIGGSQRRFRLSRNQREYTKTLVKTRRLRL